MARYIPIPSKPLALASNRPPSGEAQSTASCFAHELLARGFEDQRLQASGLDAFAVYDLRKKLVDAKPGAEVEIRDDEHQALATVFRRPAPGLFSSGVLYSEDCIGFFRSIVEAPTKPGRDRPRP